MLAGKKRIYTEYNVKNKVSATLIHILTTGAGDHPISAVHPVFLPQPLFNHHIYM